MARLKTNPLLEGLSGKIGNMVFKAYASGTVISSLPDRSKVQLSAGQKAANKKFREGVAYAKSVLADPVKRRAYEQKLKSGQSVYHLALADFMKK